MITCNECIERLKPDDPRVRSGRYHMCGCDYCNKPTYYRELEETQAKVTYQPRPIINVTYQMDAKSTPAFKELDNKIALLNGGLTTYFDKKRKPFIKYK